MQARPTMLMVALLIVVTPALAQAPPPAGESSPPGAQRGARRLFERFIEDAAIVPGGWIEGQATYANFPDGEIARLGPLIAFRLGSKVEAGLRFGWLDVDPNAGGGGSGFSDVDLFLKYSLSRGGPHLLAFGALVKAPTADEVEMLGTGESDYELFTAYRADLQAVSIVLNGGIRLNGDSPTRQGEDSILFGAGILLPATQRVTGVIEGTYETNRLKGDEDDGRLITGVQILGRRGRGGFRAAVALPLTDGAPDYVGMFGAYFAY